MKYIGMLLLFCAASIFGFDKSLSYKNSEEELIAFIELIKHIKNRISFDMQSQKEIMTDFENKYFSKSGFIDIIRENMDSSLVLKSSLADYREKSKVSAEAEKVLFEFAEKFGRITYREQIEDTESTLEKLQNIYELQKEETMNKIRASRLLGVGIGLGVVLLVI